MLQDVDLPQTVKLEVVVFRTSFHVETRSTIVASIPGDYTLNVLIVAPNDDIHDTSWRLTTRIAEQHRFTLEFRSFFCRKELTEVDPMTLKVFQRNRLRA